MSRAPSTDPDLLDVQRDGSGLRIAARVPADLLWLEGHFPGTPLVPGFVQLDWVIELARKHLGARPTPTAVEALKLRRPLPPATEFELRIAGDAQRLRFSLRSGEEELSSGRLRLEPAPPQHGAAPAPWELARDIPLALPQTGRMRLLEGVIAHEAGVTVCGARIDEATPLCRGGRAPAWLALELLAQAMAAQGALVRAGSLPARALLVGARRLELRTRSFEAGERLWVRASHLRGQRGFILCECALGAGELPSDDASARARALVWGPLQVHAAAPPEESATP